jgi:predicted MFS family arabinose efflux permease
VLTTGRQAPAPGAGDRPAALTGESSGATANIHAQDIGAARTPVVLDVAPVPCQEDVTLDRGHTTRDRGTDRIGVWQLFRRERLLQLFVLITLVANLGAGAAFDIGLPELARGPFAIGPGGYGALVACLAAGGLGGVLIASQLGPGRRPAIRAAAIFLGASACVAAIPYLGGPVAAGACLVVSGGLAATGNVLLVTMLQRWAPPEALGRVMSLALLGSLGSFPASVVLGGVAVEHLGPGPVFIIGASLLALAILLALGQPEFRHFGTADGGASPDGTPR